MSAINKYRYLQAIFLGLPMGIISLYFGAKSLLDIKQDVNDYTTTSGIVDSIYYDYLKITPQSEHGSKALVVNIDNSQYHVFSKNNKNRILTNLQNADTVAVWYHIEETGNMKIKALKKGNFNVIKYEPGGYWVGIFFILWGLFWAIISALYVFKHPEDLTGGKKKPGT